MRAVVQRVREASVEVDGAQVAHIDRGLLVLVGIAVGDQPRDADWLADKVLGLRVFENAAGRFDASVSDIGGRVLVVSQFTLCADTRRGRRPSFTAAAAPAVAEPLYERLLVSLIEGGISVARGRFGARMAVQLVNDGPVTIILDSMMA